MRHTRSGMHTHTHPHAEFLLTRPNSRRSAWHAKAIRCTCVTVKQQSTDASGEQAVHSLRGFDDVPRAVVVHMAFAAHVVIVAVVVMTLGFYFLKSKSRGGGTISTKKKLVCEVKTSRLQSVGTQKGRHRIQLLERISIFLQTKTLFY